jgi:hypothetical protein
LKKADRKATEEFPEKLGYSGYFEHDGAIAALCKEGHPDKDYGQWIEQARQSAIEAGLDSLPRFLSGTLLICSFAVIVHQKQRATTPRAYRFPVSCLISQRTRSRARTAREVITRNQTLKKIIDENGEAGPAMKTAQPVSNFSNPRHFQR